MLRCSLAPELAPWDLIPRLHGQVSKEDQIGPHRHAGSRGGSREHLARAAPGGAWIPGYFRILRKR
eukprot:1092802-Prymnesium_polylepis.1